MDSEPLSVAELGAARAQGWPVDDADIHDRLIGRPRGEIVALHAAQHGIDAARALPAYRPGLDVRFRAGLRAWHDRRAGRAGAHADGGRASSLSRQDLTGLVRLRARFAPTSIPPRRWRAASRRPTCSCSRPAGVPPQDCIVIKASVAGATAAQAAGMQLICLTAGSHSGPARLAERLARLRPHAQDAL